MLGYLVSPNKQFVTKDGAPMTAGHLEVYLYETDDRATTYSDFNGTLNPADIAIDANGRASVIADDGTTYRIEVYDASGALQWTVSPAFAGGDGAVAEIIADLSGCVRADVEQDFSDAQKALARENIGAVSLEDIPDDQVNADWDEDDPDKKSFIENKPDLSKFVRADIEQNFSDAQKAQARKNIGAVAYIAWDGTYTDNKYAEIRAAYNAGRAVLLYRGEDQFSAVVTKGVHQYTFMHIDKTYVEVANFAPLMVTIKKFDNYGMVDGTVTARYNAGQILIDGMKPGMNASYTVDWATINAGGYHPTNFVINVDRPDSSKAMFFTLNVDIPYDATYLAGAGAKNMWITVHDNVSGQDLLNSYAYQPELVMNYPSSWIYPPNSTPMGTNKFTIVCLGGCYFVLIRTLDAQIISGFELEPPTDNNGTTGLTDDHPLGRAKFHEHSNGAETSPYYLNGYSVPFKITNFDVKSYPYALDAGNTPAMAWRSLDVDRPIKNVTKLGIVTYDTTYNLAHISGIFRIQRDGGGLIPPLEKISDATTWTRISTTDTRLVPPDSSTYNIGRDTEIFQVGHSSPIYYYEFQFTKIDFEPGYRYYIPVATYRNYDYDYCKVLAMYLHPTPITPWCELTEDSDAAGTPSLGQRTSFYVAPPIRIGFTDTRGIACTMWI